MNFKISKNDVSLNVKFVINLICAAPALFLMPLFAGAIIRRELDGLPNMVYPLPMLFIASIDVAIMLFYFGFLVYSGYLSLKKSVRRESYKNEALAVVGGTELLVRGLTVYLLFMVMYLFLCMMISSFTGVLQLVMAFLVLLGLGPVFVRLLFRELDPTPVLTLLRGGSA
jgi:hypothetical protein